MRVVCENRLLGGSARKAGGTPGVGGKVGSGIGRAAVISRRVSAFEMFTGPVVV